MNAARVRWNTISALGAVAGFCLAPLLAVAADKLTGSLAFGRLGVTDAR